MCSSLGRRTCHRGIVFAVSQFTQNDLIDGYNEDDRDDTVSEKLAFFGHPSFVEIDGYHLETYGI